MVTPWLSSFNSKLKRDIFSLQNFFSNQKPNQFIFPMLIVLYEYLSWASYVVMARFLMFCFQDIGCSPLRLLSSSSHSYTIFEFEYNWFHTSVQTTSKVFLKIISAIVSSTSIILLISVFLFFFLILTFLWISSRNSFQLYSSFTFFMYGHGLCSL